MKFTKKMTMILLAVMTACTAVACGSGKDTIRVGSKDFTEGLIVAEIYALALEDAGYDVERKMDIAGSVVHTAIMNDEIDLYPEYTGTGLLSVLKMDVITDPDEVYRVVKEEYEKQFSLTWLESSQANDGQGLVIRTQLAEELGIYTISDLQAHADQIRFASQGEFDQRDDGIPGLEKIYGEFNFASSKVYDSGLKYQLLQNDEADVTPAYTTDGPLADKEQFTLLIDDKQMWPPYYLAPVVRDDVLEEHPDIADVLNKVSAALDTETLTSLNAKVDVEKREYEEVAAEFWESIR
ncbi:MAG: glycine/betaine ABC transporter substrate-binding protein [Roseburia sp.]|jgi:osmoprotectant transport system substrate-binding protein|nr:glycine/betaine ABC transporter substrate-binding protein [Roseburia sp.]